MSEEPLATVEDALEISEKLIRIPSFRQCVKQALDDMGAERVSLLSEEDATEYLLFVLHHIAERVASVKVYQKPEPILCPTCEKTPCETPAQCRSKRKAERRRQKSLSRPGKSPERIANEEAAKKRREERKVLRESEAVERKLGETKEIDRLMRQKPLPPVFFPDDHRPAQLARQKKRRETSLAIQRKSKS